MLIYCKKVKTLKKVLIIGGTIFARNRGVAALVNGCVRSIRRHFVNPEITLVHSFVESFYPTKTTNVEDVRIVMDDEERPLKVLPKAFVRLYLATLWRLFLFLHINADFLLRDNILTEFRKSDVIINISFGDIFAYRKNYFYIKFLYFILSYQSLIAILLGKPLVFAPQSIGPFESRISKAVSKFILNLCNVIIVREKISKEYLFNMVISTPIHLLPDLIFLLVPASDYIVS